MAVAIERLLTADEVAHVLGVHANYVYDLANHGDLPSLKFGGNRRFRLSELEEWLDRQREGSYSPRKDGRLGTGAES
jgi:excisionase family DNA binding protein